MGTDHCNTRSTASNVTMLTLRAIDVMTIGLRQGLKTQLVRIIMSRDELILYNCTASQKFDSGALYQAYNNFL